MYDLLTKEAERLKGLIVGEEVRSTRGKPKNIKSNER